MASPTLKATFMLYDKDRNRGTITLYCGLSLSAEQQLSFLSLLAGKIQALSNASLESITVARTLMIEPWSESLGEPDISSRVLLFYREDDRYEAIAIPAPKEEIFEDEGEYRSIRVDPLSTLMATWLADWSDNASHIATKEGEGFPAQFVVGGRAL